VIKTLSILKEKDTFLITIKVIDGRHKAKIVLKEGKIENPFF
jgi:hypothetical protein